MPDSPRIDMALTPNQIAEMIKLRALGWSQSYFGLQGLEVVERHLAKAWIHRQACA